MGKWEQKPPTKEARAQADAAFKKITAEAAKQKTLSDLQEVERLACQEKIDRLKALRLAKEAADARSGVTKTIGEGILIARKRM